MQLLCLLFFVADSQGFVQDSQKVKRELKLPDFELGLGDFLYAQAERRKSQSHLNPPVIMSLFSHDPADIELEWNKVNSFDESDPVVGYKLLYWEIPDLETYEYETVDGVKTLVKKTRPPKFTDELPDTPANEVIYIENETKYHLKNLKYTVTYEFRVQACTKSRESALSAPKRTKLIKITSARDLFLYFKNNHMGF